MVDGILCEREACVRGTLCELEIKSWIDRSSFDEGK